MKRILTRYPHWLIAALAILVAGTYWLVWASDRYVSRATVVLESPEVSTPELDIGSLISGSGSGGNSSGMLLLREYLLSVDMLRRAQEELDLRTHYATHGDRIARLSDPGAPIEDLHAYYLNRVSVELDDYAGVLNIRVQAFEPAFAKELAQLLLEAGEAHMNDMGRRLAEEQVAFLEEQVERLQARLNEARQALLDYQSRHGLVSPTQTVENLNQVVAKLEGDLSRLEAKRSALSSFQSAQSSEMVRLENEIRALKEQIEQERNRLTRAKGQSLNRISSEYKTLELKAEFAQQTYSEALSALEDTRLQAARKLKQVSVLQSPLLPEYPTRPERVYNTAVFALVTLFLAFIIDMLVVIIRDHRD